MDWLRVIKAGPMSSIQDAGRRGLLYYAIPKAGAMDQKALRLANKILGNPDDNACIEFSLMAGQIEFLMDCKIAISGADMKFQLDGKAIQLNKTISVIKGQRLTSSFTKNGFRSYLSVNGMIESEAHYASISTYRPGRLGANNGQFLQTGDVIKLSTLFQNTLANQQEVAQEINNTFKIFKGPEYYLLTEDSKTILNGISYTISADSNRMGARLLGTHLEARQNKLPYSVPVLPGFIQLPPSGQPIVILNDGQTTGGYNRIAYISPRDLSRFNQVGIGEEIVLKIG